MTLLEIRDLHVGYGWDERHTTTIVRGINLTVGAGEVVGIGPGSFPGQGP
jgi:ABC-type glutathione transport system ATPase component